MTQKLELPASNRTLVDAEKKRAPRGRRIAYRGSITSTRAIEQPESYTGHKDVKSSLFLAHMAQTSGAYIHIANSMPNEETASSKAFLFASTTIIGPR
jgi:hypothetical protein